MNIYDAIDSVIKGAPLTLKGAEGLMDLLSSTVKKQLIAAIYIGRDHLHCDYWLEDSMISVDCIDFIPQKDYAQIVYEKNTALINYLESILRCSENEGFDLNYL